MRLHHLLLLLAAAALVGLGSCHRRKAADTRLTPFEQSMTAQDTADVKALVSHFFSLAESRQYEEAAAMLYRNDEARDGDPQPEQLDNDEMQRVANMLRAIPMEDYRIEYIKFDEHSSNEVMCSVVIHHAADGQPEMATKMFFKPVQHMGTWVLCLTNTDYGDAGVVRPGKRDSVRDIYQAEEHAKAANGK